MIGPNAEIIDDYAPTYGLFKQSSSDFTNFTRFDAEFEATMCYFYIDNNMRYIHDDLGYPGVIPDSDVLKYDPQGIGWDGSEYGPSGNVIRFGVGGIDDGEDPGVIIHELGHAIHDFVTGDVNDYSDIQGLSEGFADYWANSYANSFRDYKPYESQYNEVFRWDGNNPPTWTGRRTDQATSYDDINTLGTKHEKGTIFSTVLMKIYNDIGRYKTDKAVLKGMAYTLDPINQPQAAELIYQGADDLGYSDKDLCIIYNHFLNTYSSINFDPCNETGDPCYDPESDPDVYMMDDYKDFGEEVNSVSSLIYLSEDIWVRNIDDNGFVHQNPEYKTSGSNYIYVRVRGRSCSPVEDGVLHLYWSKASTGLKWPYSWVYNQNDPNTCVISTPGGNRPCGMEIGSGQAIPELEAGEEAILKFAWAPPNPAWYGDIDQHHYCLYARIVSNVDQMYVNEGIFVWSNTTNNNNIAWKNISIFDIDPNNYVEDTISVYVVDVDTVGGAISLGFINSDKPHYESVLDNGDVFIVLREPLYTIWEDGGKQGQGFVETENDRIQITSLPCKFANLSLDSLTYYIVDVIFEGDTVVNPFSFEMLQVNASNIKVGGEQFLYPGNNDTTALPRNRRLKQINASDFIVFPNPSDQDLVIKALNPAYIIEEISIINLAGKTIIENNYANKLQHVEFKISWPNNTFPGVYFVKIKSRTGTQILKIVKN
ncbi:MAG: T9SS type A sorting domain-containing protein [Saprospiraceae bacterium]|nr:T9SS type A sorting domain-containing protein [Saprospiraceae bacterium]